MVLAHGLSGALWPIHPHPQKDELLSSWVVRLAHANGLKAQAFCTRILGRGGSFWNRDIDRDPPQALLQALCDCSGATLGELEAATLRGFQGVYLDRLAVNTNCPWVLPLGIYHRKRRRFGLQICGACLNEDSTAYFRRTWRLALTVVCPEHGRLMSDRCACGAPIAFHRGELGRRRTHVPDSLAECWWCLRRFELGEPIAVEAFSRLLAQIVSGVRSPLPGHAVSLPSFFAGLHRLSNLLLSRRRPGAAFAQEICSRFPSLVDVRQIEVRELEELGPKHRASILKAAVWLCESWPLHFREVLRCSGVTPGRFRGLSSHWPRWILDAVAAAGPPRSISVPRIGRKQGQARAPAATSISIRRRRLLAH